MILYPTETIYGLGVNVLNDTELEQLFILKGRDERKTVSWGVRNIADIKHYAHVSPLAEKVIQELLPGPLTIVLPAKNTVPKDRQTLDGTIGFRIPGDEVAQAVINTFMNTHNAPLTCTSANLSGQPTQPTVEGILKQFGERAEKIDTVVDDGQRSGIASTVVKIIDDEIIICREGAIKESEIRSVIG